MKVLISIDVINNKFYINNIYNIKFKGEILIHYSNKLIYNNEIELPLNMILWYSPYIKIKDISKVLVTLKDVNGNIFYSTTPLIYTGFMRTGNSDLNDMCSFIQKNYNVKNMIEIGSFQGESTTIFSNIFNNPTIFAVDIWDNYDNNENIVNNDNPKDIENNFDVITKDYSNIIKIKMSSEKFSEFVADNSIDFIYIDGDHTYESVYNDIIKWKNKIKINGFIGGHDYVEGREGLIKAVNENFRNYKIDVFGWNWLVRIKNY